MTDVKVPASGNIRVWWGLENAFADFNSPASYEINEGCLDISDSISWNDFDFALQASNTIEDPAITAIGKVVDRGAAQFGGSMSFYYPGAFGDSSNAYSLTYDALDQPRTTGYLIIRIDGEESSPLAQSGDLVHVFKVMTDGYAESITGEEAFRYTVTFLPQGDFLVRAILDVSMMTVSDLSGNDFAVYTGFSYPWAATVNASGVDRVYTNAVEWTSSDPSVAKVSTAGVVTGVSTGTATITAALTVGGASQFAAQPITVS
jgi:hypothetical protein